MRKSQRPMIFSTHKHIHTHDNRVKSRPHHKLCRRIKHASQLKMDKWNWLSAKVCTCTFWTCCMQSTNINCVFSCFWKFPRVYFTTDDTFRICTFIIYLIELIISKHFVGVFILFYFILSIACSSITSTQQNKWHFVCKRHLPRSNNLLSPLIIIICKLLFNSFFVDLRRQRGCMMLETWITFSIHWIFPLNMLWS